MIDEVQKIPKLLDEVHRQIEKKGRHFVLTGSSARKLKKQGSNLLAGRALTRSIYSLTAAELATSFDLKNALVYGTLPSLLKESDPKAYLQSYIHTYLKEEIQQEGLTRNLGAFSRFLEAMSFSQASVLNVSNVARDCHVERKVVEDYISILSDLHLGQLLPVFTKKAKRALIKKNKFYYFDNGVFRALRPKGPLDDPSELNGASLESLVFQELRSTNHYLDLGYTLGYWHTRDHIEVDFILYGERGLKAFEVKLGSKVSPQDLRGLKSFRQDYPMAETTLVYGGSKKYHEGDVLCLPAQDFFKSCADYL